MTKSVYEIITEKIIEKLEQGVVPWRMAVDQFKCGQLENTKTIPRNQYFSSGAWGICFKKNRS
ncbi:ArdC family protein [Neobacillus pocheonensis]|uniref:ArdC family protein n=1 Tax=Neobacillus pocheonensis TaxID=363869 RepID=A0ABT0WFR6_9BACI|nr:ArdC family protein [Neobacillus pocheonensis]